MYQVLVADKAFKGNKKDYDHHQDQNPCVGVAIINISKKME